MIKLSIMIGMVFVLFLAEIIVGYVGKSLALISDSFHMLSDGISLIVGLAAIIVRWKQKLVFFVMFLAPKTIFLFFGATLLISTVE